MSVRVSRVALATVVALLSPAVSHAHLVNTGLGPFYDGVSHFALTPEDLLPALALALLAGQRGSRAGRLTLFALPAAWLAGRPRRPRRAVDQQRHGPHDASRSSRLAASWPRKRGCGPSG